MDFDLTPYRQFDCIMKVLSRYFFMILMLIAVLFKQSDSYALSLNNKLSLDSLNKKPDTTRIKGDVSVTGLIQSGNENRSVASLLSEITIGNRSYQVLPITSIAYSTKPHAEVEGEYLENIIIRIQQEHTFYPAAGLSFEKSLLRKIDYRYSADLTMVANLMNTNEQSIKFGVGLNREFTQYVANAFVPPLDGNVFYSRNLNQIYARLKGVNHFFKNSLIFSYDFFYQSNVQNFDDYRWTLIGNLDFPINKKLSFRISDVSSYENFVATNVSRQNFRLTYGINLSF